MNLTRYFVKKQKQKQKKTKPNLYMNVYEWPKVALHFTGDNFILYLRISSWFSVVLCPLYDQMNTSVRKAFAGIIFTWVASGFYY